MNNKYDTLIHILTFSAIPYFAIFIVFLLSVIFNLSLNLSVTLIMCAGIFTSAILVAICAKDIWDSLKK